MTIIQNTEAEDTKKVLAYVPIYENEHLDFGHPPKFSFGQIVKVSYELDPGVYIPVIGCISGMNRDLDAGWIYSVILLHRVDKETWISWDIPDQFFSWEGEENIQDKLT